MRRGLTLLEVVLALALLAGVAVAAARWTALAARSSLELAGRSGWEIAAREVMSLIDEDLRSADSWPVQSSKRVVVDGHSLSIATRDSGGPCTHSYELEDGEIIRSRDVRPSSRAVVLGRVRSFEASIDEDTETIAVAIDSIDGQRIDGDWRLP